jgi:hypothetical protein
MRYLTILVTALACLLCSCGDDITNNYYTSSRGLISGRILPVDTGTVVRLADGSLETAVDHDGYFLIDSVPPGNCTVEIIPASFSPRRFFGVVVSPSVVSDLGLIELSPYPYPIYATEPEDDEQLPGGFYPRANTPILLYCDEPLNLTDLIAGFSSTPEIKIDSWQRYDRPGELYYQARMGSSLLPGKVYELTVPGSVRTEAGVPLGYDLVFSFSAADLEAEVQMPEPGFFGDIAIESFTPVIQFNGPVFEDSLTVAVAFVPAISGWWAAQGSPHTDDDGNLLYSSFRFFPTLAPLQPNTDYSMIVSGEVDLLQGTSLPKSDTNEFHTERLGVTAVSPANCTGGVSEHTYVEVIFNTPMDTLATESAFTLSRVGGSEVEGGFHWYQGSKRMQYRPLEDLISGSVYRITLSTAALMEGGGSIVEAAESYFSVR